jgi:hypothetical protein
MQEIRTSGSMSGDGKRSVAAWPKLPRPSSTLPSRQLAAMHQPGRNRRTADMLRTPAARRSDANDPSATLAVHRGNGFDADFSPYQRTRLSRYNARPELGCG